MQSTTSFSIRQKGVTSSIRESGLSRTTQFNLGASGSAIPVSSVLSGHVFVSPVTGASGPAGFTGAIGQIYSLPTAAGLLASIGGKYGKSNVSSGNVLDFTIINKGTVPAFITGSTGADSTFITVPPATANSGPTGAQPAGSVKNAHLEFTNVSSGLLNGLITSPTGSYTLY
jgi:hypothetical protein